jgi:uncharacterized protein
MVLLTQLGLFILGAGLGAALFYTICLITGWDPAQTIGPDSPEAHRWQVRLQLGIGHFTAFCVSGWLTVWMYYRSLTGIKPDWPDYLKSRALPGATTAALAVLLMASAIPLVLYTLNLNQAIPLPDYFKAQEDQTEQTLKGLLQMPHFSEFFVNMTIIAILPAIGEELVFRGVVQQQLMRRIAQPWVAILASAFIFSVAHFQFEGFIPRLLLGIILGWLYWQTNNFWVPVLAHFFNNGVQVTGQYLYGNKISTLDLEQDITVPWEFALVSLFMIFAVGRLIVRQTRMRTVQDV